MPDNEKPKLERRLRIFYLSQTCLTGFIRGRAKVFNLPEGTVIDSVYHDFVRHSFAIVLYNPAFDVVADGEEIPKFGPIDWEVVTECQFFITRSADDQITTHDLGDNENEKKVKFREFL